MTKKAYVTQVPFGTFSIEGLMDDEGNYYVGVPQITKQFQFDSNQASRNIKSLLPVGFQFDKLRTELHPKAINAVQLADFERVVFGLVLKGNKDAIEFSQALFGLSLHQLFCDAFGVEFEFQVNEWVEEWMTTGRNPIIDEERKAY